MAEPAVSTSTASYGFATNLAGGGMAIFGGLSMTEWMAILGGICALLGFIIQAVATYRKDQRDEKLYEKRMNESDSDEQN